METARIAQVLDEMGTILEIQGENPFRCRAYHNAAQALANLPADLGEMIADGSLAEVPGIGETMHAKIVQLATTGQSAGVRQAAQGDAAGNPGPAADSRARPQEDQGVARGAPDREPGGPAQPPRGGHDRQAEGVRGQDGGQHPRRDLIPRDDGRADPPARGLASGRAHPRAGPGAFPGDPCRSLRQPAAAGRDDR